MSASTSSDTPHPSRSSARAARPRLDVLLVQRGLAESRERAQALILAGAVRVDGQVAMRAGVRVAADAAVEVGASALPYVSRGGLKLAHALDTFGLDVRGLVALDAGASTGGFTDVLLQRGAARVYAVDVGYGQLAWSLRQDPRVVVLERTNVRYLARLPDGALADLATVDVSFISLAKVLPAILRLLTLEAFVVALVKPQFEAGPRQVGRDGVVHEPAVHRQVLEDVTAWAGAQALAVRGLTRSPVRGPAGNVEFLVWLDRRHDASQPDPAAAIERALDPADDLRRSSSAPACAPREPRDSPSR
jgi:23S rRNA (cytidine1920-2'-O)/16S rRNA (cytidine1409-2'-O)-methyltransferase